MYVKLFGTILGSSVWSENATTRIVWITMLAMADAEGIVRASQSGLARFANVTQAQCDAALSVFLAPDKESRTEEHEGRRIEKVDGGWLLLNYKKYREIRTKEQLANAERQAAFKRKKREVTQGNVTGNKITRTASASQSVFDLPLVNAFDAAWTAYPKRAGGNSKTLARKAFEARLRTGVKPEALLSGVERYAAFVRATGKEGTEYVKQAATFFGPSEHWLEDWAPPEPASGHNGGRHEVDSALVREMKANPKLGTRDVRAGSEDLF